MIKSILSMAGSCWPSTVSNLRKCLFSNTSDIIRQVNEAEHNYIWKRYIGDKLSGIWCGIVGMRLGNVHHNVQPIFIQNIIGVMQR